MRHPVTGEPWPEDEEEAREALRQLAAGCPTARSETMVAVVETSRWRRLLIRLLGIKETETRVNRPGYFGVEVKTETWMPTWLLTLVNRVRYAGQRRSDRRRFG